MDWWARFFRSIRALARRSKLEREMDAELHFHIESYAADLVRGGMAPNEAQRRARIEFGSLDSGKEECRSSLGLRLVDELRSDARHAVRGLARNPGFAAIAIVTLALGIGANTAIFTLVNALMLRVLPVRHAEQLQQLRRVHPGEPDSDGYFTNPLWETLRQRQDVFESLAAWGTTEFNLSRGGAVQHARGLWVSGEFFPALAVRAAAGRLIAPGDDHRGCPGVAVLSYAFWQSHFAGAGSAIGSTLSLNSRSFEIIGVAAAGFSGLDVGRDFDVALPNCATAHFDGARSRLDRRSWWWLNVVGRVKPGIAPQSLDTRLGALSPQIFAAALPPDWDSQSKKAFLQTRIIAAPASTGISDTLRREFAQPLTILMVVVGMVLLIACANVAALMLARGAAQTREVAVRLALGARRMRLVRQLLTYSVILSLAGAAAGVFLAHWGTIILVRCLSTRRGDVFLDLEPDWRIVGFTALVALVTAILFGILPAFRSAQTPLMDAMRGNRVSQAEGRSPLRKWIVAFQVALSLALLVVAGLFLRSFAKVFWLDPGFDKQNVLLVNSNLGSTSFKTEQHFATFDAIEARLAALPGVISVGRCHIIPLGNMMWNDLIRPDTPNVPADRESLTNFISPGYFSTMRMPVLAGRDFNTADSKTSIRVAIVNRAFAAKFFSGASPVGHVIRVDQNNGDPGPPIEIVGVVPDAKYQSLREEMKPTAFYPLSQVPEPEVEDTFVIRTAVNPQSLVHAVEAAVAGVSTEIPLEFNTLKLELDDAMVQERLLAMLSAFFGTLALVLAMTGLYGTVSYRVTLRQAEFGIRMALGAGAGSIVRLVIREVSAILLAGVAGGVVLSLVATTALAKLLFGVGPRDLTTLVAAAILLVVVGLLAAYAPARRASRVDPMIALRYE